MTRNRAFFGLASAAMAFALSSPASATATCGSASISPGSIMINNWSPLDGLAQEIPLTISLKRRSTATKAMRIILMDNDNMTTPLRLAATGPRYEITYAGGGTLAWPFGTSIAATGGTAFPTTGSLDSAATFSAVMRIFGNSGPVEDYIGGTNFVQGVRYSIECLDGNGQVLATDEFFTTGAVITLNVPKAVSIVSAQPAMLDFGNFTSITQTVNMNIRSTTPFNVAAVSENAGKMVLTGSAQPWPDYATIPYTLYFRGQVLLPGGSLENVLRGGASGRDYPLTMRLASVPSGKLAGAYNDVITLTVTPGQ